MIVIVSSAWCGAWGCESALVISVIDSEELPRARTPVLLDLAMRASGGEMRHEYSPSLSSGGLISKLTITAAPSTKDRALVDVENEISTLD